MQLRRFLTFASFVLVLAGCGGGNDDPTKPIVPDDGLPDGTPAADSPAHLATRLEATWESQVETEYVKLLSDDFRYHFSLAADPELVEQYPNWGADDEIAAITHLFDGFTNDQGTPVPRATRIDMTLIGVSVENDPNHADSTAQYQRMVVTNLEMTIEIPGFSDPIMYSISARHEFYLVRGDAAVLPMGSVADASRWYVRRWDDLSTNTLVGKGPVINSLQPKTLGSVRSQYRL